MYTFIPVKPSIERMVHILTYAGIHPDTIEEFRTLIQLCLDKNVCTFRDVVYQFPDGLPMGNPLLPLVADVLMETLEKQLFTQHSTPHVCFWKRYVDDILCVWDGPDESL